MTLVENQPRKHAITFSGDKMTEDHITVLIQKLGQDKSKVIRLAIETLFEKINQPSAQVQS